MHTYKKSERLANHRLQSLLFNKGSQFFLYPFRVQYICLSKDGLKRFFPLERQSKSTGFDYPAKCLIGASKRQLKKAVHRNRVKRLTKEAYRKNKSSLYAFLNTKDFVVLLAFIYTPAKLMPYYAVEKSMQKALQQLVVHIGGSVTDAH